MSRGSGSTFLKRQKEAARQQKQRDKLERKKQRKLDKENGIESPDLVAGEELGLEEQSENENASGPLPGAADDGV